MNLNYGPDLSADEIAQYGLTPVSSICPVCHTEMDIFWKACSPKCRMIQVEKAINMLKEEK